MPTRLKWKGWIGLCGIVLITGCSTGKQNLSQSGTPQPEQKPSTVQKSEKGAESAANSTAQKALPIANMTASAGTKPVAGLIQPTLPENRVVKIATGRRDPFAAFAVTPKIVLTKTVVQPSPTVSKPRSVATEPLSTVPVSKDPAASKVATNSVSQPLPPLPAPTQFADAVSVLGVMQMEGGIRALVKAPLEEYPISVRAGEYLAGGKILVRRIDMRPGSAPVVILEQNGIQVTKPVTGAQPSSQATSAQPSSQTPGT